MALLAINKRIDTLGLSINDETSEQAGTIALLKRYLDEFGHRAVCGMICCLICILEQEISTANWRVCSRPW